MYIGIKSQLSQLVFIFLFFNFILFCKSAEHKVEEVTYTDTPSQDGYYPTKDKRSKEILEIAKQIEQESSSFTGSFKMLIKSGEGLKTTDSVNGKIFYDKTSKKVKVQLLDPFFGAVLTQIISDSETIKLKPMGADKVQTLPMGDLIIQDPSSGKKIPVPYPVIYHTIIANFNEEFNLPNTKVNPAEKKVKVQKKDDEFIYVFYEKGLESLEYTSKVKNMQAKSLVPEAYRLSSHPPKKLLTRITEIQSKKDFSFVDIEYTNLKKVESLPLSNFQF